MKQRPDPVRLAQLAYALLFSEASANYAFDVTYSGRFKPYNASARKERGKIAFRLSREWENTNPEIVIGLLQHLLLRIEKQPQRTTVNIDLYNNFVKNLHKAQIDKRYDPILSESFDRVNAKYLDSILEKPNLVWEGNATRTLATYNFHDDTIRVSTVFKDAPQSVIDFLVYHEALHKLLKYQQKGQRIVHHTRQFRRFEALFDGYKDIDEKIKRHLARKRRPGLFELFRRGI